MIDAHVVGPARHYRKLSHELAIVARAEEGSCASDSREKKKFQERSAA
jgi:hypothetical protein